MRMWFRERGVEYTEKKSEWILYNRAERKIRKTLLSLQRERERERSSQLHHGWGHSNFLQLIKAQKTLSPSDSIN